MVDTDRGAVPVSNADLVVADQVGPAIGLDAQGLADFLRLLTARAHEIAALHERGRAVEHRLLAGGVTDRREVVAELQEVIYEPLCLKWFVSRAARALAEHLERDVREDQQFLPAVRRVTYTASGQVESYRCEDADEWGGGTD